MKAIDIDATRRAWDEAARELGVQVQTADCWLEDDDANRHEVIGIVQGFGARQGTALLGAQHDQSVSRLAQSKGFYSSVLSSSYQSYDRELFEATLNDWGWHGEGDPPDWYTGNSWS